jgi:hypothetical protein
MRREKNIMECIDFESDTKNWNQTFEYMCKFCGREFIDMVKTMWKTNDGIQSEEEFCEINSIPKSFFEKVIKK